MDAAELDRWISEQLVQPRVEGLARLLDEGNRRISGKVLGALGHDVRIHTDSERILGVPRRAFPRSPALPYVPFLDVVSYRFGIADPEQHYHLPMKVTPWGFSCFRGGA